MAATAPEVAAIGSSSTMRTVKPLFVRVRDLPSSDKYDYSVVELCKACEKVSGTHSMEGAQRIGGLWRLYPAKLEARAALLVQGIALSGVHVELMDSNPFLVKGSGGQEVPTTRVIISDVPLSYSNEEIEEALIKLSCQLMSPIRYECARDDHGKLTRWKTGRRFVFITIPASPLPREVDVGRFKAKLYHREQRALLQESNSVCYNCLEKGHFSFSCVNEVVCRTCKRSGHKQNDPRCPLVFERQATAAVLDQAPESWPALAVPQQQQAPEPAVVEPASESGGQASTLAASSLAAGQTQAQEVSEVSTQLTEEQASSKQGPSDKDIPKSKTLQTTIPSMMPKMKRPSSPDDRVEDKKQRKDSNNSEEISDIEVDHTDMAEVSTMT